jgi:hypothetical protein
MKVFRLVLHLPNSGSLLPIQSRFKRWISYWAGSVLMVFAFSLTACGGGSDEMSQFVNITSTSRCAISVPVGKPDNCMPENIDGGSYVTDQNTIHLSGTASAAEDDGCPEPVFFGPPCIPSHPPYRVSWVNSSNAASGNAEVAFILLDATLPVSWRTYNPFNTAIGKGIPLEMGSNLIQVTTSNSGLKGNAEITITRVVDVTPPTVHHVVPEPGGTYSFAILVYFNEQLDPASVVSAINVFDNNTQPIPGTSEFNPLRLEAIWRPDSALSPASSYTARISGVTDWAPNVMIDPYEWSFTTRP